MLSRPTFKNAVSAVMESLRHVVVQDVGKFPRRSGSPKKGCKKKRFKLIIRLSRVGISRRDSSKIFSHMISGLNLATSGKEAGCQREFRAITALLLPLLAAKPRDGPLIFWSGQSAKEQAETYRGTSLEKKDLESFLEAFHDSLSCYNWEAQNFFGKRSALPSLQMLVANLALTLWSLLGKKKNMPSFSAASFRSCAKQAWSRSSWWFQKFARLTLWTQRKWRWGSTGLPLLLRNGQDCCGTYTLA